MRFHRFDKASPEVRFWAKVNIRDETECWPWTASGDGRYGMFRVEGKTARANRFALEQKIGRGLTREEEACHTCDNTMCCNPSHLFLGSHTDNMCDMLAKDRWDGNVKIREKDLEEMRKLRRAGMYLKDIAARFNVSDSAVCKALNGNRKRLV